MGIKNLFQDKRVYLDTNIFIYALEGFSAYRSALTELFELIDKHIVAAVTSELALAESLVKPMMDNDSEIIESYKNTIQTTSSLNVIPIHRDILIDAARIRAQKGAPLRLPDAIHAATALSEQCHSFITNDKRLNSLPDIDVVLLDAIT